MGFFNKNKRGLEADTRRQENSPTGWENMAASTNVTEDLESKKAAETRQKNKLIGALLPGNGNPDFSKIMSEPNLGPHDENIVLAKISQGLIRREDFTKIISNIKGPLTDRAGNFDENSAVIALRNMSQDNHQLKILAFANDFNANEMYDKTSIRDLERAASTYDNPMQFEAKMRPFMAFLAEHNSPQKVSEYESALESVEQTLFGKKYDYYKRSKELVAESQRIFGLPEKSPLELPDIEPVQPKKYEFEQPREQLIKAGSEYQISRAQAINGQRAQWGETLPVDENCEDSKIVDLEHGFLGVFDGAGGHVGGRRASTIGVQTMNELLHQNGEPDSPDMLANWLDEAGRRVLEDPSAGYSTGTIAKLISRPNGKKAVMYAQVGDSRLYLVHADGRTELVTKDEGFENKITNALGIEKSGRTCVQAGYRELNDGDKLVLCSDGITGDKGTDLMYEDELGQIVRNAGDTAYAAQALVNYARKADDRTAVVIEV